MEKETTTYGWVARDKGGTLWVFENYPKREANMWIEDLIINLSDECFPGITWESEPKKATIKITIDE